MTGWHKGMKEDCRLVSAFWISSLLLLALSWPLATSAPQPIINELDLAFFAPTLTTNPAGSATLGDTVRITAHVGLDGGQSWTKRGVSLDQGNPGDYDSWELNMPSVILEGSEYKMWYAGTKGVFPDTYILYATSSDGFSWTKHGMVLSFGAPGEERNVHMPSVIKDGSRYRMWYSAYDGSHYRIFRATSTDGISWTRDGMAIDIGPLGSYDSIHAIYPHILLDAGTYKMWYTGTDGSRSRILYATSSDGLSWSKQGLVMDVGPSGSGDSMGVSRASIIKDVGGYHLWYSGSEGGKTTIHYAISTDGLAWTKKGMVIDVGPAGSTDATSAYACYVIHTLGMPYQMWYTGRSGSGSIDRIHYATMDAIPQPLNAPVGFYLDFVSPTSLIGSNYAQVSMSTPGTAFVDWTASVLGLHTIIAVIDPSDSYSEIREDNNEASIPFLILGLPMPDYIPQQPMPPSPITIGLLLPLQLSTEVMNWGNANVTAGATVAFCNESGDPFALIPIPPLEQGAVSPRVSATWISPDVPGTYTVFVDVDHTNNIIESDETNNNYTWTIDVVRGPMTSLIIGLPKYESSTIYVRSHTSLYLFAIDYGGSGIRNTTYRIDGGDWMNFTAIGQFSLSGDLGHLVEWYSVDWAGNREAVSSQVIHVDDTAPFTTINPSREPADLSTSYGLNATDNGSGVRQIEYVIDSGTWFPYTLPFQIPAGIHTIWFRSVDNIGNVETPRSLVVEIVVAPPSIYVELDYKPIIATVFAIILGLLGFWASRRKPWRGETQRVAVLKSFAVISLPFIAAETLTGVLSWITGFLSIPPIIGLGTAVDLTILLSGIVVAVVWASRRRQVRPNPKDL